MELSVEGMSTLVRDEQPLNAAYPIESRPSGSVKAFNPIQPLNA